jgi:hypothetical protein
VDGSVHYLWESDWNRHLAFHRVEPANDNGQPHSIE